jgi:sideroflexin-5
VQKREIGNTGATMDMSALMQSYGMATVVSCSLAIGAGKMMKAYPGLAKFGIVVPYFAVISASTANIILTRMQEMREGVPVMDADGNELGVSQKAGVQGVWKTTYTRLWMLPVAFLIIPPTTMLGIRTMLPYLAVNSKGLMTALEIGVILTCLQQALPLALAVLPQTMELDVTQLEPEFHSLRDKKGNPIKTVFANKGL